MPPTVSGRPPTSAIALLSAPAGIDMEHVPYDSTGVLERVVAGEVALACSTIEVMREKIKAGRLRSLAVTSARAGEAAAGCSRHGRRVRREIVRPDLSALRRRQK
jgi:hypothetical protein